jgi:squalene-hopene/tetraprenyl-beta-curcumene cyclase
MALAMVAEIKVSLMGMLARSEVGRVAEAEMLGEINTALGRTVQWLVEQQHPDGWWRGELETSIFPDAEELFFRHALGVCPERTVRAIAQTIRAHQASDGGWAMYPGGPRSLSLSVEAYVALRIAGDEPSHRHLRSAAHFIRSHGGVEAARPLPTKFWLAVLGAWPWSRIPLLPPELLVLRRQLPLSVYDLLSWARAPLVATSIVKAGAMQCRLGFDIAELYHDMRLWKRLGRRPDTRRGFGATSGRASLLPGAQRIRDRALNRAEQWLVGHQGADGTWAGSSYISLYAVIALRALGYTNEHPVVRLALEALDRFTWQHGGLRRLETSQGPVWDTAVTLALLLEARVDVGHPAVARGVDWLLDHEVRLRGDWSERKPSVRTGGCWSYQFLNDRYPDLDDTAAVVSLLPLVRDLRPDRIDLALERSVGWITDMQWSDGGWACYDPEGGRWSRLAAAIAPLLGVEKILDLPSADITAHSLESLCRVGLNGHQAVERGLRWLERHQAPDGAWYGQWGVNYVYGTGSALSAAGVAGRGGAEWVRRGVAWLERHQNSDGGWGETPRSYEDRSWAGRGESAPSQTAEAVIGLVAAAAESPALERGIRCLLDMQKRDGTWQDATFNGTGWPGTFYIHFHMMTTVGAAVGLARYARTMSKLHDLDGSASEWPAEQRRPHLTQG